MKTKQLLMIVILAIVFISTPVSADIKNPDKPAKGDWDFKARKLWEIDNVGGEVLARPMQLLVSNEGKIYLHDRKIMKMFMLDTDGKFIKHFAPQGEGPGEVRRFYEAYLLKDKMAIASYYILHYFKFDGTYIRSIKNPLNTRYPRYFFSDDEFAHYSTGRNRTKGLQREIAIYNFKTEKENKLVNYLAYEGGIAWEGGEVKTIAHISGVSPCMVATFTPDKFYYGYNNQYEIKAAEYKEGKTLLTFSVDRPKKKLTKEDIDDFFEKNPPPRSDVKDSWIRQIKNSLPHEETYFSRMTVRNGLLYVEKSYLDRQPKKLQIDIFTLDGKYVYRAFINAPENSHVVAGPYPVFEINGNRLFVAVEDDEGEGVVKLAGYEIDVPKK